MRKRGPNKLRHTCLGLWSLDLREHAGMDRVLDWALVVVLMPTTWEL